jgi:putative ABC transport system substrate-binding protein
MKRRIVGCLVLILFLITGSLAAAQQPGKVPRIAFLRPGTPPESLISAFRQGLLELGSVEGKNINIDYRFNEEKIEKLPDIAAELVRLNFDVIVTASTPAALAARKATPKIPIVFTEVGDPVGAGVVESLAHPGGNITGVSSLAPDLSGKRVELLKEVVPRITRLTVIRNPKNPTTAPKLKETEAAAMSFGLRLNVLEVRSPEELNDAFIALKKDRPDALAVLLDTVILDHRRRVAQLAAEARLPAIYEVRELVDAGGLMSYGTNFAERYHRAATFVDKILKGAKPADLPVEQPTKFEFIINLKAAKQIGLTIPPNVLARADKVIK